MNKYIKYALESVVANGSGRNAYIENYRVGGKTGTAQKVIDGKYAQGKYICSFMGIAPTNKRISVCVMNFYYFNSTTNVWEIVDSNLVESIDWTFYSVFGRAKGTGGLNYYGGMDYLQVIIEK